MFELKSSDELSKIVNDWINSGMPDGSEGTSKGGPAVQMTTSDSENAPAQKKRNAGGENYRSIDDAFADLIDS
jgi:hypothetical protein